MDANQNRALQFIEGVHDRLAEFARQSYSAFGRGVVRVAVPDMPPPGATATASTEMVYHTENEIRELTQSLADEATNDAATLMRMIETYDPLTQAVVTAALAHANPITIKMKLDAPVILDEAKGVH
jgi:hypothetical protein